MFAECPVGTGATTSMASNILDPVLRRRREGVLDRWGRFGGGGLYLKDRRCCSGEVGGTSTPCQMLTSTTKKSAALSPRG